VDKAKFQVDGDVILDSRPTSLRPFVGFRAESNRFRIRNDSLRLLILDELFGKLPAQPRYPPFQPRSASELSGLYLARFAPDHSCMIATG